MERINDKQELKRRIVNARLQELTGVDVFLISELIRFKKGEYIIREGFMSDYVHFLVVGDVNIFSYSVSSKLFSKGIFHPPQILGEGAILWGDHLPGNTIQTLTDCLCVSISARMYRDYLLDNNSFLRYLCKNYSFRLNDKFISTHADSLRIRIADFILRNSVGKTFSYNLTQCAVILGSTYSHLHTELKKLCDTGVLEKFIDTYIIINKEQLQAISKGELTLLDIKKAAEKGDKI